MGNYDNPVAMGATNPDPNHRPVNPGELHTLPMPNPPDNNLLPKKDMKRLRSTNSESESHTNESDHEGFPSPWNTGENRKGFETSKRQKNSSRTPQTAKNPWNTILKTPPDTQVDNSKTKSILFSRHQTNSNYPKIALDISGEPLQQVTSYKYLGYKLDLRLDFKPLIQDVLQAVHHKIYVLNKIRSCISSRTAVILYKSKVLPCLDYADILYNDIERTQTWKLQVHQNRSLQIAFKNKCRCVQVASQIN